MRAFKGLHPFSALWQAILAGNSTQYMMQGFNLAINNSYGDTTLFANVLYQMLPFARRPGFSGAFTQDHGLLNASVSTDEFQGTIVGTGEGMPAGTYTVYNPSGANIAFGGNNSPTGYTPGGYSTATNFTFDYPGGTALLALFVKGSLTNSSGNLIVALPGVSIATILAGNVWNPAYLSFRTGLGGRVIRMMDWNDPGASVDTDWADRVSPSKISFANPLDSVYSNPAKVPYEFQIDLANRTNTDPWICVPPRATPAYLTQLGTLIKNTLNPGLRAWIEMGNEIWNNATAYADGTHWVTYSSFTKYTAVADAGANTLTLAGHGLVDGEQIRCFNTKQTNLNYNAGMGAAPSYEMSRGTPAVVTYIDANTFRLRSTAGGANIPVTASQTSLLYCKSVESGKTADLHGNYGRMCVDAWDVLDPIIGVGNYNRMIVRMAISPSSLTDALAIPGVASRASYISCAPYLYSMWWMGKVAVSSGAFTPSIWVSASKTVHISVYAAGSTPTDEEIIAGTGAVSHQSVSATYTSGTWQAATAVTGLTNGTDYKVYFLVADTSYNYVSSQTVTASATASSVYFYDSFANQALRDRAATKTTTLAAASAFMAAGGGLPMVCYEGGLHNFEGSPSDAAKWMQSSYQESDEFASVIKDNLYRLASIGCKGHVYYSEMTGWDNVFTIADGILDVTDKRYVALASLNGRVAVSSPLTVASQVCAPTLSLPSLPYIVHTLPAEEGRTYAIVGGNNSGNYDVYGNTLRMVSAAGIDFGTPTTRVLSMEAYRGSMSEQFTATLSTGDAWYDASAKWAWSTITDTDSSAVNPTVGSSITLTSGTAPTPATGLWTMAADSYYSNTTSIASNTPSSGTPFLFAMVMDKFNLSSSFKTLARLSGANFVRFYTNAANFVVDTYFGTAVSASFGTFASLPTGAHVYWAYFDGAGSPTMYIGRNQSDVANVVVSGASGNTLDRTIVIGNASGMGHKQGSIQFVSKSGMTLADAKAIVAKMQTHHGIA